MDNKKDTFGLLPVTLIPNFLYEFLGYKKLVIDFDKIVISNCNGKSEQKIPYSKISNVSAKNNTLIISGDTNELIRFKTQKTQKIADLLLRLRSEYITYLEVLNSPKEDNWFSTFETILTYRAMPYVWAVNFLLKAAAKFRMTDMHFEPEKDSYKVTYRKNSQISLPLELNKHNCERIIARLKYLSGCQSHISDTPQEGAFKDNETEINIRFSSFPADYGERVSLRFINRVEYNTLKSLNWPESAIKEWRQAIQGKNGLYLITGPVGSGKTTALYATLCELVNENSSLRVVTVEDPVEAIINGICQSSLDKTKGLTLSEAFKHILRQDPDILALGEIRDKQSIKEALQASLSGHKIFATFHAGSAKEAVNRIKQIGFDDFMILSGIKYVLELQLMHYKNKVVPKVKVEKVNL